MAEHAQLTVWPRNITGKQVRRLRRSGMLPGIIFGPGIATPQPVSVDAHLFEQIYRQSGTTNPVELAVDGQRYLGFIRRVERHPWRQEIQHVDFHAPSLV
jgi:large subunit ribosomal protein L25